MNFRDMLELIEEKTKENFDDPCWDGYTMISMKTKDGKKVPNCVKEMISDEDITLDEAVEVFGPVSAQLQEAEYQGRTVTLNKPIRSTNGPKKFHVFVKNDKGNVVKVNFGDPDMKIKKNIPGRRKSFRARHNCDDPGPKHKARYWSCKMW